ncbi:hypothetical protein [Mesorhizobium sp.]|uniref:hypothetical protein n=1 Tax=Mesorhizobium sp. TaxID=1871066 RepID=UPI000FE95234|nr:hypothetical protein [Mesorhizobium sp.]RWM29420.1 MAG: hypothetical protein EOR74_07005 [Mesorhizobium sp.]
MRTAEQLVSAEVHYCVSSLVATLANGTTFGSGGLTDLVEQARELTAPLPDYEEAAREADFEVLRNEIVNKGYYWRPRKDRGWVPSSVHESAADAWRDCCEENDIEPYDREVFEHWIVSDWLAEKLAAKGEKVDTDFAGMTVWARTTTGQAISIDAVIVEIVADLSREG